MDVDSIGDSELLGKEPRLWSSVSSIHLNISYDGVYRLLCKTYVDVWRLEHWRDVCFK